MPDTTQKSLYQQAAEIARNLFKAQADPALKAAVSDELKHFDPAVQDLWQEGEMHTNPSKREIVTGPPLAASGAGAAAAVDRYSHPAPQEGLVGQYSEFGRMIASLSADMAAVKSVLYVLTKANAQEPSEGASYIENAAKLMKKARVLIVKAEMSEDEDEDEDLGEDIEKAISALKKAKGWLLKAQEDEKEDHEEEVEKAMETLRGMRKRLAKAADEYKARVEKIAAAKAAAADAAAKAVSDAAAKAAADEAATKAAAEAKKADDKGNQEAAKDPKTGNQEDEAAKSANTTIDIVTKTVTQVMNTILGNDLKGKTIATPPDFAKAAQAIDSLREAIEDGQDNGSLTAAHAMQARSIMARIEAVRSGALDRSVVADQIAKAAPEVQQIFGQIAA